MRFVRAGVYLVSFVVLICFGRGLLVIWFLRFVLKEILLFVFVILGLLV
jgi:hypothetical protein